MSDFYGSLSKNIKFRTIIFYHQKFEFALNHSILIFSAYKVAGDTSEFVNRVLCKVEEGDPTGGLDQS